MTSETRREKKKRVIVNTKKITLSKRKEGITSMMKKRSRKKS